MESWETKAHTSSHQCLRFSRINAWDYQVLRRRKGLDPDIHYQQTGCCCCCSSVSKSCLTLCDSMACSIPGLPALTISWSLPKLMSTELAMLSNHPLPLSCPFAFSLSQDQGLFHWMYLVYKKWLLGNEKKKKNTMLGRFMKPVSLIVRQFMEMEP